MKISGAWCWAFHKHESNNLQQAVKLSFVMCMMAIKFFKGFPKQNISLSGLVLHAITFKGLPILNAWRHRASIRVMLISGSLKKILIAMIVHRRGFGSVVLISMHSVNRSLLRSTDLQSHWLLSLTSTWRSVTESVLPTL